MIVLWQNGHMTGNKITKFIDGTAMCKVCNGEIETPLHTFWYCKSTQMTYKNIQKIIDEHNIHWKINKEEAILGATAGPKGQVTEKNLLLTILRHNIWRNRNRVVFEGIHSSELASVTWFTFRNVIPHAIFLTVAPGVGGHSM